MANFIKKSVVLSVALMAFGPLSAGAMTVAELQAQLNVLIAQLNQMQSQQANASGAVETANADCTFATNLYAGLSSPAVKCLQNYLVEEGFLKVTPTGYFGSATKTAVARWQAAHDISASGYFGEISRRTYASLAANIPEAPVSEEVGTTPVYCAQVLRQCADGSLVGYKPNTCEYYACPVTTTPANKYLTVTYPRGGETWTMGSSAYVSWTATNVTGVISAYLVPRSNQQLVCYIGDAKVAAGAASFNLSAQSICADGSYLAAGSYQVKLYADNGSRHSELGTNAWSSGYVTVNSGSQYSPASITVTSGAERQTVGVGTSVRVTWSTQGVIGNLGIGFCPLGQPVTGNNCTMEASYPNTGVADVKLVGGLSLYEGQWVVHIMDTSNRSVYGRGNDAFIVVSSNYGQPAITLLSPTSGSVLTVGQTYSIQWKDARGKGETPRYYIGLSNNYGKGDADGLGAVSCSSGVCSVSWTPRVSSSWNQITIYDLVNDPNGNVVGYSGAFSVVAYAGTSPASITASVNTNSAFSNPTYTAGSNNVKLASFVVSAPTASGIKISTINLDKDYSPAADLQNLRIMASGSQFGSTKATISDHDQLMMFSAYYPIVVPAGGAVTFDVYGDIKTSSESGTYQSLLDFISWSAVGVNGGTVTNPGEVSGQTITVGSAATVSRLTLTATALGSASGRVGTSVDDLATITASTNLNVMGTLKSLSLNLSGDALQSIGAFSVSLIDPNTNTLFSGTSIQTCHVSGNACRVSFTDFNSGIFAGGSKTMKVRVSSTGFGNASYGTNGLRVTVRNADVTWNDGIPNTTLTMGNTAYELVVANVTYQMGSTAASVIRSVGFSPSVTAGATNQKIAQFNIYAPANQSMMVSSVSFTKGYDAGFDLQNMKVMVVASQSDGQLGVTRATIGDAEVGVVFSGGPVYIPQNTSVGFAVYADVLGSSTTGTHYSPIDIISWSAVGSISGSAIAFPGSLEGPNVYVSAPQSGNLTIALSSQAPPYGTSYEMGTAAGEVLRIRFTAGTNTDIRVTDFMITDGITANQNSGKSSFTNFTAYNGDTAIAGPVAMVMDSGGHGTVSFAVSGSGFTVPAGGSADVIIKADVASAASGSAVSGSSHVFELQTGNIHAQGANSSSVLMGGIVSGNAISVR